MAASRKLDFINGAYSELRINGLTTDPDSFELTTALYVLEDMAYQLFDGNIIVQYNFTDTPDLNDLTGVDPALNRFFKTNLAVWLCNAFGKDVPQNLAMNAAGSMSFASGIAARALLNPVQYPDRMPVGAGVANRYRLWQRFQRPGAQPPANSTTHQMYIGDINDYQESWETYLGLTETITAITSSIADPALLISNVVLASPYITYTIEALSQQTSGNFQQVKFVVTTSLGRVNTRLVNFNITQAVTIGSIL
jgi:hypothetical protein